MRSRLVVIIAIYLGQLKYSVNSKQNLGDLDLSK